jgi:arginyl-tRNA synthetase
MPSVICKYIYDLCVLFNSLYHNCKILDDEIEKDVKNSRLQLCTCVLKAIENFAEIIAIDIPDKM